MSTIPFTYYLYHIPTGKKYYGVRYAKNCNPLDLWTTYFSSSTLVKLLVDSYGYDSFRVEIRKIFNSPKDALAYEQKVLRRLRITEKEDWLNRAYSSKHFYCEMTDEIKEHLRRINLGKIIDPAVVEKVSKKNKGKKRTTAHKEKYSQALKDQWSKGIRIPPMHNPDVRDRVSEKLKGRILSEEHKRKIRESSIIDRQKRRDNGWRMPVEAVESARQANTGRKHSLESIEKMKQSKKGKVRHYRLDGTFYMDYPS